METQKRRFNPAEVETLAHLKERAKALEPFGWTGRRAQWIALACFHGGVFTRVQWTSFLGCHHEKVRRAVGKLVAQGVASEESPAGIAGIGRVCRIHGRRIYRALGMKDRRRRRITSGEVLMRRLLALDYVLEHPHLLWLPTEPEMAAAFEALRIERRILPPAGIPGRAWELPAPLPARAARRAGRRARRLRLRRAGSPYRYSAPFLGCGARRTLEGALGSWMQDRHCGGRPDMGGRPPGGDGARQLGAVSTPVRNRRGGAPRHRTDRAGHPQGRCPGPRRVRRLASRHETRRRP